MLNQKNAEIQIIIVMGVSGAGKTTVGKLLAECCQWRFADADDFHSTANKAKMHSGLPLDDKDREPWLNTLAEKIKEWTAAGEKTVLACSALKASYRSILSGNNAAVAIVYLKADYDAIASRLQNRQHQFMNKDLLKSQFAALEEPQEDDTTGNTIIADGENSPTEIIEQIKKTLHL